MNEINKATTSLQIAVRVAIESGGKLITIDTNCERLPWIKSDEDFLLKLQECLDSVTSGVKKIGTSDLRKAIADRLSDVLQEDGVFVEPTIKLTLEEHIKDGFSSLDLIDESSCVVTVAYDHYLQKESQGATANDISIVTAGDSLFFHPDPSERKLDVHVIFRRNMWLESISVILDNKTLAERKIKQEVAKGERSLSLPTIPMRDYPKLSNAESCKLRLTVGRNNNIDKNINVETFTPKEQGVSLFVDMGSTRSKMIEVKSSESIACDDRTDLSPLKRLKAKDVDAEKVNGVTFYGPIDTEMFITEFGLPIIKKKKLASISNTNLAITLGEAVSRLGSYYANQNRILMNVFWSFPRIGERDKSCDLNEVSKMATNIASSSILGSVYIVPEHYSLRYRFQSSLHRLAKLGIAKQSDQDNVKARNLQKDLNRTRAKKRFKAADDEYNARRISKLWHTKPVKSSWTDWTQYDPEKVPTVKKFYKKFMDIDAEKELKDFIVLDGGGFSFDVYGRIGNKKFGESFAAGGEDISGAILKFLAEERNIKKRDVDPNEAEALKLDACRSRTALNRPLAVVCKAATKNIYAKAIRKVVEWIENGLVRGKKIKGVPLILTGGAMYNDFLKEEIERAFESIPSIILTSTQISEIIEKNEKIQVYELPRFYLTSKGFIKQSQMDIARDVSGGLVEYAIEQDI